MGPQETIIRLCRAARQAARLVARAPTDTKNRCLRDAAARLWTNRLRILEANSADLQRSRDAGLSPALLDRLALSESRVEAIAKGLDEPQSQEVLPLSRPGPTWQRWHRSFPKKERAEGSPSPEELDFLEPACPHAAAGCPLVATPCAKPLRESGFEAGG